MRFRRSLGEPLFHVEVRDGDLEKWLTHTLVAELLVETDGMVPGVQMDPVDFLSGDLFFEALDQGSPDTFALEIRLNSHLQESPPAITVGVKENASDDAFAGDSYDVDAVFFVVVPLASTLQTQRFSEDSVT